MFQKSTARLVGYWASLAGDALAPRRADFDPIPVAGLLPQMFVVIRTGEDLVFRLAGERLRNLSADPLRDNSFLDLFTPSARPLARRTALEAVRDLAPMTLLAAGRTRAGREVVLEIVVAPLLAASGAPDRLVGLFQPVGAAPEASDPLEGGLSVRMASAVLRRPPRPRLRLAAVGGRRIA